jgi:hypothetical protein
MAVFFTRSGRLKSEQPRHHKKRLFLNGLCLSTADGAICALQRIEARLLMAWHM